MGLIESWEYNGNYGRDTLHCLEFARTANLLRNGLLPKLFCVYLSYALRIAPYQVRGIWHVALWYKCMISGTATTTVIGWRYLEFGPS